MWFAALWGSTLEVMGSLVGRALISAGIGYASYKSLDVSVGWAKSHFFDAANGLPPIAVQVLGVCEVDTSVEMMLSAILMRLTYKGMVGGVMKTVKIK